MVGRTLGHYRLTRVLGSGGMGTVYLAEDLRLKRQVALKTLPRELAEDASRRERFEREAQAIAALNHPNIVTVHSVEQDGDTHFITMEYVEGRTLADLLPRDGLPLGRLLPVALQIADAVAAAHARGIVHRDLKPANVLVSAGDRVKVLDFGLAKAAAAVDAAETMLPTRELTGEGKIVGTVAYMSPEQAEGRHVDERSDIFSFGVILYELATGARPFTGDTSLAVLSAILRDAPKPLIEVNSALPRDLGRIVRHCLAKDADRRYQSAKDLRHDLEDLAQALTSGELDTPPMTSGQRRRSWVPAAIALGGAVLVAVGAFTWWRWPSVTENVAPPAMSFSRLTQRDGVEQQASLSPDGKWVVYVSAGDIVLQSVTGQTAINLMPNSPGAAFTPAFSPDGESIVFQSTRDGGGIFVMGRTGESVRRLSNAGAEPAWFPDGRTVIYSTRQGTPGGPENRINLSELWTVSMAGGEPRRLYAGDAVQPRVSPNGRRIAFWALPADVPRQRVTAKGVMSNRDIWTIDVNGQHPVRVAGHDANDWNPVWSPDGNWLYFLSSRSGSMNLWRIAIDEASGETRGAPQALTAPATYVSHFGLSSDGRTGVYTALEGTSQLASVGFDAAAAKPTGPIEPIASDGHDYAYFDVTPDGRQIVASTSSFGQEDVFVVPLGGGGLRRLTNDFARDRAPKWAAGGPRIFLYSDRRGYELWSVDADGSGLRQLTSSTDESFYYPVPSPDGARVVANTQTYREFFIFDAADFSKPLSVLPRFPDAGVTFPRVTDWSADGRKLVIVGVGGSGGIWVYDFDAQSYRKVAEITGATEAIFLRDSRRILYEAGPRIRVVDTTNGVSTDVLAIKGEVVRRPQLAVNDTRLFFQRATSDGDLWLVRFDAVGNASHEPGQ